jgi:hypothetical protein
VLPVYRDGVSPLNAVELISDRQEYHGLCGLTENEVHTIARAYLSLQPVKMEVALWDLWRWYRGHLFCRVHEPGLPLDTLYCPELVFAHLRALEDHMRIRPIDEIYHLLPPRVLDAIPDEGRASFIELFYRVQCGRLKADVAPSIGATEASQIGINPRTTQTLLYYFGIFTYTKDGRYLKMPHSTMINVVSTAFPSYDQPSPVNSSMTLNGASDSTSIAIARKACRVCNRLNR